MQFGDAERQIVELLNMGETVQYGRKEYKIKLVGKPTVSRGEPKTDIYVLLEESNGEQVEVKISFKKSNADFLENKISAERAEQLFGSNWADVIKNLAKKLSYNLRNKEIVYFEGKGKTQKGSITLGWKFELVNKDNGQLSEKLDLSTEQIVDVYSGTTLIDSKKHASVNGVQIQNSGVATHILVGELSDNATAQDVFNNITTISQYCSSGQHVFGAFKALNYRTFAEKDDGNRPLGVYISWSNQDGLLTPDIEWENPLSTKGEEMRNKLLATLKSLDAKTTDDLKEKIDPDVKYCA